MDMERLISSTEAANILWVSSMTVIRLCKAGELRATMVGNTWVIDRESVEEYRRAQEEAGASP